MPQPIKPSTLLSITDLFTEKEWEINTATRKSLSLFEKFCERLKLFTSEEQDFLIEMSYRFVRVGLKDYLESFYMSFLNLGDDFFQKNEKIFVLPLVAPYINNKGNQTKVPRSKTKSANFLHYMIECDDWTWISTKLIFETSIKALKKSFDDRSTLVLIDDYIGSGNTAIEVCSAFLAEMTGEHMLIPEKIKVVSIAAQRQGIEEIHSQIGIEVIANLEFSRGITDFYNGNDLVRYVELMRSIERKLNIGEDYNFGYSKTEGLITFMNKTPNNTFPVYWHETKSKVAPFPRYKKYSI